LAILDEYILAFSSKEVYVIELSDFSLHSKITFGADNVLFNDNCVKIGTGVRN